MGKKKKYLIYAIIDATKFIGEFSARSKEEAEKMADKKAEEEGLFPVFICHQCSDDVEIGDFIRYQIEEVTE